MRRFPPNTSAASPLAQRVKALRFERGLTQFRLAILAGCSPSSIATLERGCRPGPIILEAVAKALDAPDILVEAEPSDD